MKANPCIINDPCQNGATCVETSSSSLTCTCLSGYEGVYCEYGI